MTRDDPNRPYDWQDRLVIGASVLCIVACVAIMVWGR